MAEPYDILIIGGGVNGCGIARDAAGRGLRVLLVEKDDLAQATSSASTKLFHGGLRYLEYFEFRLVREALRERETLLRAMPHISWPMRFVLPIDETLRYENDPTSLGKVLRITMPWLRGRRPAWMTRLGLFIYDNLGGRKILPATRAIDLSQHHTGAPLKPTYARAFEYSDCWIEDARLVSLNARDAAARGATILTRTTCTGAARAGDLWHVDIQGEHGTQQVSARTIVNAGGPWVSDILNGTLRQNSTERVRLVRGSHIVTHKLFDHDQPYFLQQPDGRIIFAIPYETDFTLIGTTDHDHQGDPTDAVCTKRERDYLLSAAAHYFQVPLSQDDVVWTYSGVRPLYDDDATSATAATREYVLSMDEAHPPLLNVFGGKITTYRRLAEEAVGKLAPRLAAPQAQWTAGVPLPGGDFAVDGVTAEVAKLRTSYAFLDDRWALRLIRAYGTDAAVMLSGAKDTGALGQHFGWNLYAREVDWLMKTEFARTPDDVLWRRTKIGLRLSAGEAQALATYMAARA
ncbi:MAG: glycerol-3-phosphate dehydrogenase [Pikeienuella sp.]